MPTFSLKDHVLTIGKGAVTEQGVIPLGAPFRLATSISIKFDPGGQGDHLPSAGVLPDSVIVKMAKPKIDIECSDGRELAAARRHVGGIYSDVLVGLTMVRIGLTPLSYLWPGTWINGGGIMLDEGKGFGADTLSILATDCLEDLVSIYNSLA